MRRRDFLRETGVLTAGGLVGAAWPVDAAGEALWLRRRGQVVQVLDRAINNGPEHISRRAAARAVDLALTSFTGDADAVTALSRFVGPEDIVGLKVNTMGSPHMAFNPEVTARLLELLAALGVPPDKTIVYDQFPSRLRRAGYRPLDQTGAVKVLFHKMEGWGYDARVQAYDAKRSYRWSRIPGHCTAILNLCVPKDHDHAGITGALKNMACGNIDAPQDFHKVLHEAIPRLYGEPMIKGKVRLVMCDASRVLWHGGPQDNKHHRAPYGSLLVGTDPVAMDWAILEIVNAHRERARRQPIEDVTRPRRRPPTHIWLAAAAGLGGALSELRWTEVRRDGSTSSREPFRVQRPRERR